MENEKTNKIVAEQAKREREDLYIKGFDKLVGRLNRAVTNERKWVYDDKNHLVDAKAKILSLMDNLVRFIREHPELPNLVFQRRVSNVWFDAVQFVGLVKEKWSTSSPQSLSYVVNSKQINLTVLEDLAGLPPGATRFGTCMICGRPLSNQKSMERGIGPECEKKVVGK